MTAVQGPTGVYRPCAVCAAPIVDPFPPTWEIEMIKEGPPSGPVQSFITIHRDTCDAPYADPQPGLALRLPGHTVATIGFTLSPAVADDALGRTRVQHIHDAHDPEVPVASPGFAAGGWTPVGFTAEGYAWTYTADDVDVGQAVQFTGPDRQFVKPVVPYDVDADPGQPVIDAILDAAQVDSPEDW